MEIKKVAVVGAGIMGHGIAQVLATSGYKVSLTDIKDEFLTKAKAQIDDSLEKMQSKGKINCETKTQALNNLTFTTKIEDAVSGVDLVVEAILEIIDFKKELFRKLDKLVGSQTILASNTSQYSITDIAAVVSNPSRVIGMHWFNPPVLMKLIEIVRGLETSDEVLAAIKDLSIKAGKEIVVCKDSQGFISTRVLMAQRLECYRILEEGIATKEDIDKTLKLALGHPMGQFELSDFSGVNLEVPICEAMTKIFGDRFRAPQNLLNMVRAGRYGKKYGKGWYDYTKK